MGLKNMFGLFEREDFVLPDEEELNEYIEEINEKLAMASGSERTKLIYMLANSMVFLNQLQEKKKPKKPIKLNTKGKWVWVDE